MNESPTTKSERLDMTKHRSTRALRIGALAVPVMGALILAGCSGSGGGEGDGDGGSEGAAEFSFTFATSNNLESPYETLAKAYMEANEDVTITTNPHAERQVRRDHPHPVPGRQRRGRHPDHPRHRRRARHHPARRGRLPRAAGRHGGRPRARGQRDDLRDRRRGLRPAASTSPSRRSSPAWERPR